MIGFHGEELAFTRPPQMKGFLLQAIESSGNERGGEKEWYYGNADKERNGPVGFSELKGRGAGAGWISVTQNCQHF
jgi:hypothetical protein